MNYHTRTRFGSAFKRMGTLLLQAVPASSKHPPALRATRLALMAHCVVLWWACAESRLPLSLREGLWRRILLRRAEKWSTRGAHALYAWPSLGDLLPIVLDQMLRSASMCVHGHNRKPSAVTWMPLGLTRLPLALVLINHNVFIYF